MFANSDRCDPRMCKILAQANQRHLHTRYAITTSSNHGGSEPGSLGSGFSPPNQRRTNDDHRDHNRDSDQTGP